MRADLIPLWVVGEKSGKKVQQVMHLQGASIGTETDHRLCMLGYAATPFPFQNQAQESSQEGFNFMVKVSLQTWLCERLIDRVG